MCVCVCVCVCACLHARAGVDVCVVTASFLYHIFQKFYQHMINLDRIKNFLASPLRKGPNNENYCTTVKAALGWLKEMPPLTSF